MEQSLVELANAFDMKNKVDNSIVKSNKCLQLDIIIIDIILIFEWGFLFERLVCFAVNLNSQNQKVLFLFRKN